MVDKHGAFKLGWGGARTAPYLEGRAVGVAVAVHAALQREEPGALHGRAVPGVESVEQRRCDGLHARLAILREVVHRQEVILHGVVTADSWDFQSKT